MTTESDSLQAPQWHDFSESEVDFTLLPYHQQYATTLQPLAGTHHWQESGILGRHGADPLAYSTAPKVSGSPLLSDQAHAHSSSGMTSTMGHNPTNSYQLSPADGSLSSSSPQMRRARSVCPLLTGQMQECTPQYCGIDAPCLSSVTEFPEIEESDLVLCVQQSYLMGEGEGQDVQMSEADVSAYPAVEDRKSSTSPPSVEQKIFSSTADNNASKPEDTGRPKARQAHSLVERKYRENLNAKIEELREALQKTRSSSSIDPNTTKPSHTCSSTGRIRKGDILGEALSYIYQSQVDMRHMAEEIARLKAHKPTVRPSRNKCDDCSLRKQIVNIRLLADGAD